MLATVDGAGTTRTQFRRRHATPTAVVVATGLGTVAAEVLSAAAAAAATSTAAAAVAVAAAVAEPAAPDEPPVPRGHHGQGRALPQPLPPRHAVWLQLYIPPPPPLALSRRHPAPANHPTAGWYCRMTLGGLPPLTPSPPTTRRLGTAAARPPPSSTTAATPHDRRPRFPVAG